MFYEIKFPLRCWKKCSAFNTVIALTDSWIVPDDDN
ncbi:hypothetical protein SAMN06269185_0323 [Natronoarchaeum philippinense]|uniref:Uncharacterized protein n=1 Tax=Natronoarchaeum philippinense TaxID=558529 RepID=A0A285N2S0_NATPI|nr:hypothetical protein SAMN06269185_0323 [Natronoarchaeum philippinense]